jgi:hypothetical protein
VSTEMAREDVERLVRIEAKLDLSLQRAMEDRVAHDADMAQLRETHDKDVDEIKGELDRLVTRTGTLENWRYAIGAALLMSSAGAVGAAINIVPK